MAISGKAEKVHIAIPDLRKKYSRKTLSHSAQGYLHMSFHCNFFCKSKNMEIRNRRLDK